MRLRSHGPGNKWVYAWRNASNDARKLHDGKLVVVVWGRDRSSYEDHDSDDSFENWGSETSEFVLDSIFNSPLNKDGSGGSVQPEADSEVKEPRPFVYLDFRWRSDECQGYRPEDRRDRRPW